MNEDERIALKRILMYIKIARNTDHVTNEYLMHHPMFGESLKTLEGLCDWSEADQVAMKTFTELFLSQTKGKTLKEKGKKMDSMAWRLGKLLAVAAVGYGVAKGVGAIGSHKKETPPSQENGNE